MPSGWSHQNFHERVPFEKCFEVGKNFSLSFSFLEEVGFAKQE